MVFHSNIKNPRNGKTGGIVAASALEADETVLNNINSANTVVVANLVQELEESNRVGLLTLRGDDLDGNTLLEVNGEVVGSIGGIDGVDGAGPELLRRRVVRVLENTGLVRAVDEVVVHAPGSLGAGRNGDVVLGGKLEEIGTALELLDKLGKSPWGDDLHGGVASLEGKLEADLVIALAGAAVTKEVAVVLLSNADLSASDDGAGEGGTEEVAVLVDGVALDGAEDNLLDELALEVLNDHALSAKGESLLLNRRPVLLLTDVSEEANDGVALLAVCQYALCA